MSNTRILFVDDEQNILKAYLRQFGERFQVETASGGPEALQRIDASDPFAIVISDYRMPGMNGVDFLARVREQSPLSVRMMLTGCADLPATIASVNKGHIFRFLSKPCPTDVLASAVTAGLEQFRLVTAEKQLLEDTLHGCIRVLTEVLSLTSPLAFGRAQRIRALVGRLVDQLQLEDRWRYETAAMLSQLGCVALPDELLHKVHHREPLTGADISQYEAHPAVARDLLNKIPRLETIAEIIGRQHEDYVQTPAARHGAGVHVSASPQPELPLGSRVLRVAIDFDALESADVPPDEALHTLRSRPNQYDSAVVDALEATVSGRSTSTRPLSIGELIDGMVLAQDLYTTDGHLLVARGQEVTPSLRHRLLTFARQKRIREPVTVNAGEPGRGRGRANRSIALRWWPRR